MDPITALTAIGLVCNITQVVEQGLKLAKCCREISKTGSTTEIKRLKDFNFLASTVSRSAQQSTSRQSPTWIDHQIQQCALRCIKAAEQLSAVVQDIWYKKNGRTERSLPSKSYRSLKKRPEVDELHNNFSELQLLLQTSILTGLRSDLREQGDNVTQHLLSQDQNICKLLDGNFDAARKASEAIKTLETRLGDIKDAILQQTKASEAAVVGRPNQMELDERQRQAYERLMSKLAFESMHDRENQIRAHVHDYGTTISWLLEGLNDHNNMSHNHPDTKQRMENVHTEFTSWLSTGRGIWFIEGKPGSGKSSLMSFIRESFEVGGTAYHLLAEWTAPSGCAVLSFFFYRPAATSLAKSSEGLWRSLCWQILDADQHLMRLISESSTAPRSLTKAATSDTSSSAHWRADDLKKWCLYLLSISKLNFLLLLDGLDEIQDHEGGDEGHAALLNTIRSIDQQNQNVKLICSARPDEPFKSALAAETSFKLQDVNYLDIVSFVHSSLAGTEASHLAMDVANSASGVFLWAHLVVKDLVRAANRKASRAELQQRLHHCPKEMHGLYRHMLARQDDFYLKHPEPILRLMQIARSSEQLEVSLFDLLMLSQVAYSKQDLLLAVETPISGDQLVQMSKRAKSYAEEVIARGGGLLQADPLPENALFPALSGTNDTFQVLRENALLRRVEFIHRTALDFLAEDGVNLIRWNQMTQHDGFLLLAMAEIAALNYIDATLDHARENALTENRQEEDLPETKMWEMDHLTLGDWLGIQDRYARIAHRIDAALCQSDLEQDAVVVLSVFVRNLTQRTSSIDFDSWCRLVYHQVRHTRHIWFIRGLPRDIQFLIHLAVNHEKIIDSCVVPTIERLPEASRSTVAALALRYVHANAQLRLLPLVSPFDELALSSYPLICPPQDTYRPGLTISLPFWAHFASYWYLRLLGEFETRSHAVNLLKRFFDAGVGKKERCGRYLQAHHSSSATLESYPPEASSPRILQEGADQWYMSQLVEDLPLEMPWRIAANTCMRSYSPLGSWRWIPIEDDIIDDLFLEFKADPYPKWAFGESYPERCVDLVNSDLDKLREDLEQMVTSGWGFFEGRACHHPSHNVCDQCSFNADEMYFDSEMGDKYRDITKEDLHQRGMIPPKQQHTTQANLDHGSAAS